MQRTPWPIVTPVESVALPCNTMLDALGFCPLVVNTRLSFPRRGRPVALRCAPPVPELLSHPSPRPVGGLEQGQGITPPWPGSQSDVGSSRSGRPQVAMLAAGMDPRFKNEPPTYSADPWPSSNGHKL